MFTISGTVDEYIELVRAFPLVSIEDDRHLDQAIMVLHRLLNIPERSEGQEAYLGALGDLIETYETVHVNIPKSFGLDVLTHLMEASKRRRKAVPLPIGVKEAIIAP